MPQPKRKVAIIGKTERAQKAAATHRLRYLAMGIVQITALIQWISAATHIGDGVGVVALVAVDGWCNGVVRCTAIMRIMTMNGDSLFLPHDCRVARLANVCPVCHC